MSLGWFGVFADPQESKQPTAGSYARLSRTSPPTRWSEFSKLDLTAIIFLRNTSSIVCCLSVVALVQFPSRGGFLWVSLHCCTCELEVYALWGGGFFQGFGCGHNRTPTNCNAAHQERPVISSRLSGDFQSWICRMKTEERTSCKLNYMPTTARLFTKHIQWHLHVPQSTCRQ